MKEPWAVTHVDLELSPFEAAEFRDQHERFVVRLELDRFAFANQEWRDELRSVAGTTEGIDLHLLDEDARALQDALLSRIGVAVRETLSGCREHGEMRTVTVFAPDGDQLAAIDVPERD